MDDLANAKIIVRILTGMIFIFFDLMWIAYSIDDQEPWWSKLCVVVNLLILIGGTGAAAAWAWT